MENDPKWEFTRFDPDEVELVGSEVKVRGRMTVGKRGQSGQARVRPGYTFIYPLAKCGGEEVVRAIVRMVLDVEVSDLARFQRAKGDLWVFRSNAEIGTTSAGRVTALSTRCSRPTRTRGPRRPAR
ncbi:hypothetical protein DI272_42475 [Streptomyces sp. Act143]|uniref:hypothetical protein n=1 Tax=Streptomyces sp. Act143 TaxID=2200760 RepID=UPI000D676289|nr:hypothetical protein [Streptomyces sp. Act143]PWI20090.1 hypothetical protein DI272_42475 [Streptomyces sp. Act143]